MFRLLCLCIGYAIGCIQFAYIMGKVVGKIDIREHGSGSAGMTNVTRILGAAPGFTVFVLDVLKAVLAFLLCSSLFDGGGSFMSGANGVLPGIYAGLGVVLGHNFPVFLKFRGGKGIASTLGIILCLNLQLALICYVFGIIIVALTRYISLASLVMTVLLPVLLVVFRFPVEVVVLGVILAGLACFGHRGNIQRLMSGTERKFKFGKG